MTKDELKREAELLGIFTRVGNPFFFEVRGTIITISILSFISFGDTIKHGLVFFTSDPIVGSRLTSTNVYRFNIKNKINRQSLLH